MAPPQLQWVDCSRAGGVSSEEDSKLIRAQAMQSIAASRKQTRTWGKKNLGQYHIIKYAPPAEHNHQGPPPAQSPSLLLPTYSHLNASEVAYFEYFRHQVVRKLTYEQDGPAEFWTRTVMRESTRHSSILDAIIGIGAIARARSFDPDPAPLYKRQLSGGPSGVHYRAAVKYYTRALSSFRAHISCADPSRLPRTVLVATLLWNVFERLQGDLDGVDRVISNGINLLKGVLLQTSNNGSTSLIASPLDDEGVLDAEYFLIRTVTWNAQYLPIYPLELDSILCVASSYGHDLPTPEVKYSLEDFWRTWWRFVTYATIWTNRVWVTAKTKDCLIHLDPVLGEEQKALLSQSRAWEAACQKQLDQEKDAAACCTLKQILLGAKFVSLSVYCRGDGTGALWDACKDIAVEILDLFSSIVRIIVPSVYGSFLLVVIAQQCRDFKVRSRAMQLLRKLVHDDSGWDVKGIIIGTYELILVEESGRDAQGVIPILSRYDWTSGRWSDDCSKLYVTLTAKLATKSGERQQKHLTLYPKNYGFI